MSIQSPRQFTPVTYHELISRVLTSGATEQAYVLQDRPDSLEFAINVSLKDSLRFGGQTLFAHIYECRAPGNAHYACRTVYVVFTHSEQYPAEWFACIGNPSA